MSPDKAAVAEMILSAFPAERPSDHGAGHRVMPLGFFAKIAAGDRGLTGLEDVDGWQDIDVDVLATPGSVFVSRLPDLPMPMWAFYLPAYLLATLKHGREVEELYSATLSTLLPGTTGRTLRPNPDVLGQLDSVTVELLTERRQYLSPVQDEAVRAFLSVLAYHPDFVNLDGAEAAREAIGAWEKPKGPDPWDVWEEPTGPDPWAV